MAYKVFVDCRYLKQIKYYLIICNKTARRYKTILFFKYLSSPRFCRFRNMVFNIMKPNETKQKLHLLEATANLVMKSAIWEALQLLVLHHLDVLSVQIIL